MVLSGPQIAGLATAALAAGAALGFLCAQRLQPPAAAASEPVRSRGGFPKRLILVRHGESEGNIDPLLYCHVPDNAMHLTTLGYEQAVAAGRSIKSIVGDESVRFIVSPYVRTIETFQGIKKAWARDAAHAIPWSEEPRIREQDFGNFQEPLKIRECKAQRRRFGSFFYRFPSGESPADVFDRISSFLESLHRMFEKSAEENYVLVTHGVSIRVILTRYFKYRISEFEQMENFYNGEFVVLDYDDALGKFRLSKLVRNHVAVDADGHVTTTTHEADNIRMHEDACMSPASLPYPTSPVNHFRRSPPSPPPISATPAASSAPPISATPAASSAQATCNALETTPEYDVPLPVIIAVAKASAALDVPCEDARSSEAVSSV
ncbi:hypothetical protein PybrP1_012493 [[Pythium] brassicae (nom. inval.)]|nr:hypothetical protein PybrP1_012493 [[Pythium] brassicae (nom. inval.)]